MQPKKETSILIVPFCAKVLISLFTIVSLFVYIIFIVYLFQKRKLETGTLRAKQHVFGCGSYIDPHVTIHHPPRPHSENQPSSGRNSGHKIFTHGEKVTALPIRQFPLFIDNHQSFFARPPVWTGRQRDFLQISSPSFHMISLQYKSA